MKWMAPSIVSGRWLKLENTIIILRSGKANLILLSIDQNRWFEPISIGTKLNVDCLK